VGHVSILIEQIIPLRKIVFKKLIVAQVVKKLLVFYGIRRSITVIMRLQYVYTITVCDIEVHMLKNTVLWGCDALHIVKFTDVAEGRAAS
jgi:hypothetical protein